MKVKIHRDSHGRYWMDEKEIKKIAGPMEVDSSKTVELREVNK